MTVNYATSADMQSITTSVERQALLLTALYSQNSLPRMKKEFESLVSPDSLASLVVTCKVTIIFARHTLFMCADC